MLSSLKSFFTPKASPAKLQVVEDIPRYPPFAKGLPAASADRIVETQDELIKKLRLVLRFNQKEFEELVMPVVTNYAGFVHLLPASEKHHHRGAGGLFRHGLEVALWAAQTAEAHQFCVNDSPKHKRINEIRWQFAAFLGGLLHDVGKPLSDVQVVDESGEVEWNPYKNNLSDWLYEKSLDRYFIRWRDQRKKSHTKYSLLNIDQIITTEARIYLNEPGPHIMESLLESIIGTSANDILTKIVIKADQQSATKDMIAQKIDIDEHSYGVPVERFIFDALRRLAAGRVNEPGAHIWRLDSGVFIAWKQITPQILKLLREDNIPGIPNQYTSLAEIMLEKGFASHYFDAKEPSVPKFLWPIYPESLKGVNLLCLKIDEVSLIFPNEPPQPVRAGIGQPLSAPAEIAAEIAKVKNSATDSPTAQQTPNIPFQGAAEDRGQSQDHSSTPPPEMQSDDVYNWEDIPELASEDIPPPGAEDMEMYGSFDQSEAIQHPVSKPTKRVENQAAKQAPAANSNSIAKMSDLAKAVDGNVSLRDASKKARSHKQKQPAQPTNSTHAEVIPEDTEGWEFIAKAIEKSNSGTSIFKKVRSELAMPYPDKVRALGAPRTVMNVLHQEELIKKGVGECKTVTHSGNKYLVFTPRISTYINKQIKNPPIVNVEYLTANDAESEEDKSKNIHSIESKKSPSDQLIVEPNNNKTKMKSAVDTKEEVDKKSRLVFKQKKNIQSDESKDSEALEIDVDTGSELKIGKNKFKKSEYAKKKLLSKPSVQQVGNDLKEQMKDGKGPYIEGEVSIDSKSDMTIYRVNRKCISKIANETKLTKHYVKMMLNEIEGITLVVGSEYIEYTETK